MCRLGLHLDPVTQVVDVKYIDLVITKTRCCACGKLIYGHILYTVTGMTLQYSSKLIKDLYNIRVLLLESEARSDLAKIRHELLNKSIIDRKYSLGIM